MNQKKTGTAEPKTCEACGETFGCGANLDGCWCVNVELSPERTAELNIKYQDCLCPKCLNRGEESKDPK